MAAADVLYTFADPLQHSNRKRGAGIGVIDGKTFTDLCTIPLQTDIACLAVDHRDRFLAVVDVQSLAVRVLEVRLIVAHDCFLPPASWVPSAIRLLFV